MSNLFKRLIYSQPCCLHDKEDCVLFITNNGDQSELRAMVKVVSDYNIPIITISSSEHNHVAQRF